jgi:4-hydroxybenzoate polyprenyltransferase
MSAESMQCAMRSRRIYWEFARPFTLLAPAVGMLAGGCIAWGAEPRGHSPWVDAFWKVMINMALGALMASTLNAASNGLNQIFDFEIDRVNKPNRPLPSKRLSLNQAWKFTTVAFAAGLLLAWAVNWECFLIALFTCLLTAAYSVPQVRIKRWSLPAALTIAIPRGVLLTVAGWSTVKSIGNPEPWLLALPLGLFMTGAIVTKDFSDIAGDQAGGCKTWPIVYGTRKAAWMIAPFLVLPFPLWSWFARKGWFSISGPGIHLLSLALPVLGIYTSFRILKNPEELGSGENHVCWKLIYLMVMTANAGLALLYLLPR